jgi:hypothetical protein
VLVVEHMRECHGRRVGHGGGRAADPASPHPTLTTTRLRRAKGSLRGQDGHCTPCCAEQCRCHTM